MVKKKTDLSYEEASLEIQKILDKLESGEIAMDNIIQEVERATELIQYCKNKLHQVSDKLKQTFEQDPI
jgi:exodeoxyribonuclease VII small subunit